MKKRILSKDELKRISKESNSAYLERTAQNEQKYIVQSFSYERSFRKKYLHKYKSYLVNINPSDIKNKEESLSEKVVGREGMINVVYPKDTYENIFIFYDGRLIYQTEYEVTIYASIMKAAMKEKKMNSRMSQVLKYIYIALTAFNEFE